MPQSIRDFEIVVNDGTPVIPACLSDLPNKVRFSASGCSSDRFAMFNIGEPQSSDDWWGTATFAGSVFDELAFWLDREEMPTFVLLLLSQQTETREIVIGALAGTCTVDGRVYVKVSHADSDDSAEALRIIRAGMAADGLIAASMQIGIPSLTDIPEYMDFRA